MPRTKEDAIIHVKKRKLLRPPTQDITSQKEAISSFVFVKDNQAYLTQLATFNPEVKALMALNAETLDKLSPNELEEKHQLVSDLKRQLMKDSADGVRTPYFVASSLFMMNHQANKELLDFLSSLMPYKPIISDGLRAHLDTYEEVQKGINALGSTSSSDDHAMRGYAELITDLNGVASFILAEQKKIQAVVQPLETAHTQLNENLLDFLSQLDALLPDKLHALSLIKPTDPKFTAIMKQVRLITSTLSRTDLGFKKEVTESLNKYLNENVLVYNAYRPPAAPLQKASLPSLEDLLVAPLALGLKKLAFDAQQQQRYTVSRLLAKPEVSHDILKQWGMLVTQLATNTTSLASLQEQHQALELLSKANAQTQHQKTQALFTQANDELQHFRAFFEILETINPFEQISQDIDFAHQLQLKKLYDLISKTITLLKKDDLGFDGHKRLAFIQALEQRYLKFSPYHKTTHGSTTLPDDVKLTTAFDDLLSDPTTLTPASEADATRRLTESKKLNFELPDATSLTLLTAAFNQHAKIEARVKEIKLKFTHALGDDGVIEKQLNHLNYLANYKTLSTSAKWEALVDIQTTQLLHLETMSSELNASTQSIELNKQKEKYVRFMHDKLVSIEITIKTASQYNEFPYFNNNLQNPGVQAIQALTVANESGQSYLEQFKTMVNELRDAPSEQSLTINERLIEHYKQHITPQEEALKEFNQAGRMYVDGASSLTSELKSYLTTTISGDSHPKIDLLIQRMEKKEEAFADYCKKALEIVADDFKQSVKLASAPLIGRYNKAIRDLTAMDNFKTTPEFMQLSDKIQQLNVDLLQVEQLQYDETFISTVHINSHIYTLERSIKKINTQFEEIDKNLSLFQNNVSTYEKEVSQNPIFTLCDQTAEAMKQDIIQTIKENASKLPKEASVESVISSISGPERPSDDMLKEIHPDLPAILTCYRIITKHLTECADNTKKEMFTSSSDETTGSTLSAQQHLKNLQNKVVGALTNTMPELTDPNWKERFLEWIKPFTDWVASLPAKIAAKVTGKQNVEPTSTSHGFFTTSKKRRLADVVDKFAKEDSSKGP
jgi:hypothetical protein